MKGKDIRKFIKDYKPTKDEIEMVEDMAEKLKDKDEDEFFLEIIRINDEMESEMSPEQYQAIFEKLDAVRPLLSEEQNLKLDRILEILDKDK